MKLLSTIDPNTGTVAGLLTAAGVYLIYNNAMPSVTDLRTVSPFNKDADQARKTAAYESAALIAGVFVITRNLDAFMIGGAAMVGIDLMYRHADAIHPSTGKVDDNSTGQSIAPGLATAMPLAEYQSDSDDNDLQGF